MQHRIGGELLDYWPTKHKWRFRDQLELLKGKSCKGCKHWLAGALGDDIWGECSKHSTEDETKFTEATDSCLDHTDLTER
jgi:hypothetical protein